MILNRLPLLKLKERKKEREGRQKEKESLEEREEMKSTRREEEGEEGKEEKGRFLTWQKGCSSALPSKIIMGEEMPLVSFSDILQYKT